MTADAATRVAATLVTGFLGSGKTTLLNRLLAHPDMGDTAVIVNEFGEIGLDHLLIETALEDAVLLQSGCICCTIRGDLVDTLATLHGRRERGEVPPFRRVAIETTGLADPAPILQTLMADEAVVARYRLERVVTTVDAVNAPSQLDEHFESAKQAAVADRIVLTKTDLAPAAEVERVIARLRRLNATAPILPAVEGRIEPALLFAEDPSGMPLKSALSTHGDMHERDHEHEHHHGIETFSLVHEGALAWHAVRAWLASLAALRGPDLLRVKGIVHVEGRAGPVVIHGVQHVFHPPRELKAWPGSDRRTLITFITRNIPEERLRASFAAAVRGAAG